MPISSSPEYVVSKDLLLRVESGVEVTPYPDQQLPKCPAFAGAQFGERRLLGLRLAAGDRPFEGATLPVRWTRKLRASVGSGRRSTMPHPSSRRSILVMVGGSTPRRTASSPLRSPSSCQKLDEQHLLADVQSVFGQERADMTAVGLADLRQHKARVLSYLLNPDRCSSISVNRLMPPSAPSTYRSFS